MFLGILGGMAACFFGGSTADRNIRIIYSWDPFTKELHFLRILLHDDMVKKNGTKKSYSW